LSVWKKTLMGGQIEAAAKAGKRGNGMEDWSLGKTRKKASHFKKGIQQRNLREDLKEKGEEL